MSLPGSAARAPLLDDMASYLAAGIPMPEAVEALRAGGRSRSERLFLGALARSLADGRGVADAFRDAGMPAADASLIEAGERSGSLDDSLRTLAAEARDAAEFHATFLSRLIYPVIILHLAIILPVIPALLDPAQRDHAVRQALELLALGYALAALATSAALALRHFAATNPAVDRLLAALPMAGPWHRTHNQARFLRALHTQITAGVNAFSAFHHAGEATTSARLRHFAHNAAANLRDGHPPESLIAQSGLFPPTLARQLESAADHGDSSRILSSWTNALADLAAKARSRAALWIPKLIGLAALLAAGWQIIQVYSNILNSYSTLIK